ncbi:DUF1573 domain-containing protein [Urechidicola vernalis]|uniref:DUF1573 domain-containing protein n=1 Tax=Urechidicola vernalis TaxID=3075600 RepID=A0ABU2Y220_9FLAO|nr:DUF1573 domain-containing protein [Urechidicola sp. P050]MDT0552243.1 DUF1573 domain-containing protein [Urechidicola sp. P050]
MKKLALVLFLSVFTISLNAQDSSTEKQDGPAFKFEHETIDYGKIVKGSNGERSFVFTNVGNAPLVIERVQGSCGCTVPTKPEKPILPGEKGEIKVKYDTNRTGGFSKTVTIISNATEARKVVRIKGLVEKPSTASVIEKEKSVLSNN